MKSNLPIYTLLALVTLTYSYRIQDLAKNQLPTSENLTGARSESETKDTFSSNLKPDSADTKSDKAPESFNSNAGRQPRVNPELVAASDNFQIQKGGMGIVQIDNTLDFVFPNQQELKLPSQDVKEAVRINQASKVDYAAREDAGARDKDKTVDGARSGALQND